MESVDHTATTYDEGWVAPHAGRSGPQHAAHCGGQAETLPGSRGRSVL